MTSLIKSIKWLLLILLYWEPRALVYWQSKTAIPKNDWRYNNDDRTKLKIEAGYAYVANSNDIDEYIVLLEKDIYVKKSQINIEALSKKLEII